MQSAPSCANRSKTMTDALKLSNYLMLNHRDEPECFDAANILTEQAARIAELEAACREAIDWYPSDAAPPYMTYIRGAMKGDKA